MEPRKMTRKPSLVCFLFPFRIIVITFNFGSMEIEDWNVCRTDVRLVGSSECLLLANDAIITLLVRC
jgi:hypothetical protein